MIPSLCWPFMYRRIVSAVSARRASSSHFQHFARFIHVRDLGRGQGSVKPEKLRRCIRLHASHLLGSSGLTRVDQVHHRASNGASLVLGGYGRWVMWWQACPALTSGDRTGRRRPIMITTACPPTRSPANLKCGISAGAKARQNPYCNVIRKERKTLTPDNGERRKVSSHSRERFRPSSSACGACAVSFD